MRRVLVFSCAIVLSLAGLATAQRRNDTLIVRVTSKSPDEVVAAIKSYSERKKWQYLGESKVKKGEVRLVKLCIPEVGQLLWPAGLQLSAMLPCGNLGVYAKGSTTEISLMHPPYMHVLYPDPATERASAVAEPLLYEMLDEVTK